MKKIILGMLVFSATLLSAQYGPNNGWGNNNAYGDYDNQYYFPEDYYYEYPNDYYSNGYYQDFYGDYQQSISMVNWTRFFREMALTAYQINMIVDLNRQFNSYNVWNSYYRMNPVRWYYDRFYALEQILGPRVFVVFQNRYYNGYSPVVYYNNRCNNFYRTRYVVRPRYRSININIYKVNKNRYHQSVGNRYGWNQPRNTRTSSGFRNDNGYRSNSNANVRNTNQRNNSVRSNTRTTNSGNRSVTTPRTTTNTRSANNNSSVRNTTPRANNNTRNSVITPNRSSSTRSSNTRSIRNNNSSQRSNSSTRVNSSRSSNQRSNSATRSSSSRGRG